ncbi:smad nuclear-interacting protein 1-like protein [Blastocystis sp. ATCC 50177/Nand II]|uniref:Smad nuclear-interacting protein 1-like protein n=1 Tax=Blastocystis sp. subtype 1 (strain ATCC 50177 / NandII) TaxID=478820 RepID=A0A196S768_BLAHN|nr:smad nuclear-interacting protein 1-like protein [Blastocystis sp. ATCC 50177/Nand II]
MSRERNRRSRSRSREKRSRSPSYSYSYSRSRRAIQACPVPTRVLTILITRVTPMTPVPQESRRENTSEPIVANRKQKESQRRRRSSTRDPMERCWRRRLRITKPRVLSERTETRESCITGYY